MTSIKLNQFIRGAFLLTIIGIISKILSAFYRIPIQNVTGDIGFYTYQQVYPFIATVMILSLYSFPSAISTIGAGLKEKHRNFKRFVLPNFIILFLMNSLLFLIVFMLAPVIAVISGNPALQSAYETIAFAFLIIPFLAISRGYFQSKGEMHQTAYSQLLEQIVRVSIIIFGCFAIYTYRLDVFTIGYYGSIASIISMLVAAIFLLRYFRHKSNLFLKSDVPVQWKSYIKTIFLFGFIFALNHMMFILIQFADVFTLIPSLVKYGLSSELAMTTKGIYDRAIPLIQLGVVIGSSFAIALIPMMANNKSEGEKVTTIQHALSLCIYLSASATIGLIVLFPEINLLLFKSIDETGSLRIFSITALLLSIALTLSPILQIVGKYWQTILYIIISFIVKIALNMLLVPMLGLMGASYATIISISFLTIIVYVQLKGVFPKASLLKHVKWKAFSLAIMSMVGYLYVWKYFVSFSYLSRSWLLGYVMFLVITGAGLFFVILLRFRAFSEKQLRTLPFSSHMLKYAKKS